MFWALFLALFVCSAWWWLKRLRWNLGFLIMEYRRIEMWVGRGEAHDEQPFFRFSCSNPTTSDAMQKMWQSQILRCKGFWNALFLKSDYETRLCILKWEKSLDSASWKQRRKKWVLLLLVRKKKRVVLVIVWEMK